MRPALTPRGAVDADGAPASAPWAPSASCAADSTATSSAAMNISYANTPTAWERLRLVGPVPPVYLSDFLHSWPWPAVGMATHACA